MIKLNQHKIFFNFLLSLPLPNVRTFISLNPKAKRIMVLAVENDIFGYIAEKSPIFNPLLEVHSLTYCMKF